MTLPDSGLILIAGANNSGKSALLSILDVVAGDVGDIGSWRHAESAAATQVVASFALADAERRFILQRAANAGPLFDQGAMTKIRLLFEARGDLPLALIELQAEWPGHGLVTLGSMRVESATSASFETADWMRATPGTAPALQGGSSIGGGNVLAGMPLLGQGSMGPFNDLLTEWQSRFYHFRALRMGTSRSQPLAAARKLEPTGGNLAAVLLHLATDRRAVFEKLQALITEIVPDTGLLQVRTDGDPGSTGSLRVAFESSSGDLNLKDLGTGVEQLLMTLVVGLTEEPPFTLIIEEPETNLHPAAQRALLGLLRTWADDRLIIAATHSPVMLDWSPGGDRLWLVTRDQNESQVEHVGADPLPVLNALGVRLSDVLSADRVLVVEGPSDEDVLGEWFPDLLRNPRVAVLRGWGGDNARHADQLAEWLAGTDRAGLRRVLYLRDRDELSPDVFRKLEASPTVYVLRRRELENYLLDPAAVAAVLTELIGGAHPAPSAEDVQQAMHEAAESLRRTVVVNRVARRVVPPEPLMNNELRQQLAREQATEEQLTEAMLNRLLPPETLRSLIRHAWADAEADVNALEGDKLLATAPGEQVLDQVFKRLAGRRYDKRQHARAIAKAMESPPAEVRDRLNDFLADETEHVGGAPSTGQ